MWASRSPKTPDDFFSFILCALSLSISFVSLYTMSLWNMCIVLTLGIPPPNGRLFYLFYSVFRSFNCFFSVRSFDRSFSLFSLLFLVHLLVRFFCCRCRCCLCAVDSFRCYLQSRKREFMWPEQVHIDTKRNECIRLYTFFFLPFIARMQSQWINGNICVTCSSAAEWSSWRRAANALATITPPHSPHASAHSRTHETHRSSRQAQQVGTPKWIELIHAFR